MIIKVKVKILCCYKWVQHHNHWGNYTDFYPPNQALHFCTLVSSVYLYLGEKENYRKVSVCTWRDIPMFTSLYCLIIDPSIVDCKGVFVTSLVIIQERKNITAALWFRNLREMQTQKSAGSAAMYNIKWKYVHFKNGTIKTELCRNANLKFYSDRDCTMTVTPGNNHRTSNYITHSSNSAHPANHHKLTSHTYACPKQCGAASTTDPAIYEAKELRTKH